MVVSSSISIKNRNRHNILSFCMFLSTLATTRLIVTTSLAFAPSSRHSFHNRARFWNQSQLQQQQVALLQYCRSPRRSNHSLSPPSSGIMTASMSAVSEDHPSLGSNTNPEQTDKSDVKKSKLVAKCVPATLPSLAECGSRLRAGNLVSFPTETVYGLGCHALDPVAVQKVFDAKERPLSDPLIVHVTNVENALELWDASCSKNNNNSIGNSIDIITQQQQNQQQIEKKALTTLTQNFFPGPLTLVAKAHPSIPQILMANTGFVACRSPSHAVARALIDAAGVPIAAPSANKFGHVSPTRADHVMDDLGMEDVWIVNPMLGCLDGVASDDGTGEIAPEKGDSSAVCQVGVESTVAKIEMYSEENATAGGLVGSISILRHGAISSRSIRQALEKAGLGQYFIVSDAVRYTSEEVNNVAPGQTVKHYSPNVPCFMISPLRQQGNNGESLPPSPEEIDVLSKSVIIDYSQQLSQYKQHSLAYRDLSSEGNPAKAAAQIFDTLRWSESIDGAIRVFVPDLSGSVDADALGANNSDNDDEENGNGALVLAVKDKLTRAASGVVIGTFQ